jgi:DNA-binding NarL/FixJ family response regulator
VTSVLRLLLVDDHPLVLSGLSAVLSGEPDLEVAATAPDGATALAALGRTRVDIAVVDLRLPDTDGTQLCRRMLLSHPGLRIVVLTMHADEDLVLNALAAGASAYVLKDSAPADVVAAIREVSRGNLIIGARARPALAGSLGEPQSRTIGNLSPREHQILDLLARGLSTAVIGQRLGLSPKTVRNQLSTIFAKIGVTTRTAAAVVAREAGLGRTRPGP